MRPTLVKCDCCNGTGKAKLTDTLQKTLDVVPRGTSISTHEIAAILRQTEAGLKNTAVNNRLAIHLLPLGLVTNERRGKSLFWKRLK